MTDERRLVVSIHDVMPGTLDKTEALCTLLRESGIGTVTLLVVPGTGWNAATLERLRELVSNGAILAGHGWTHHAPRIRGWYHRLHSLLISRDAAEHLSLDADGIRDLILRNHAWFRDNDLPMPTLYVPPAWAMGRLSAAELGGLPFDCFETLSGVYDRRAGRFLRSPMVGYEADNLFRALSCRAWNAINLLAAGHSRPVRVAIHPHDLDLRLSADLRALIDRGGVALDYGALYEPGAAAA